LIPASGRFGEPLKKKGRNQMSFMSSFKQTLVAISAALAMSTVAVGAAVGPANAAGTSVQTIANA
jgi:F0F1-type ATP synthase membrane subunit c/vacuolar-type H+-ATPase subunit K